MRIFFSLRGQFNNMGQFFTPQTVTWTLIQLRTTLFRRRPFCFVINIGVDTKTVDIEVTDEANWP
jgi:hypothetical protein